MTSMLSTSTKRQERSVSVLANGSCAWTYGQSFIGTLPFEAQHDAPMLAVFLV